MTVMELVTTSWAARKASGVVSPTYLEGWTGESDSFIPETWSCAALWIDFVLPVREEEMSYRSTEIVAPEATVEYVPRTPLGKKLLLLRNRAIRSGMRLLSADEILEEVKRRRGEFEDDEADVY